MHSIHEPPVGAVRTRMGWPSARSCMLANRRAAIALAIERGVRGGSALLLSEGEASLLIPVVSVATLPA